MTDLEYINATPELKILLYDLYLTPEQIVATYGDGERSRHSVERFMRITSAFRAFQERLEKELTA